jgi:uncharacterized membrane protein YkvA (DUF1232 family)
MRIIREMIILAVAVFLVIYLLNPTAGFLELLPDNLPFIGNLDEATAVVILLRIAAYYGINLSWLTGGKPRSRHDLPPGRE